MKIRKRFQVLDRLEVGPPVIEAQRLTVPYTVTRGNETETIELAFRWEEAVFDLEETGTANLAAMVGAQVALNYGLFCKEIVFRGEFDDADRRFLADMARNTAREIYVKKLCEPNPFLVDGFADFTPERLEDFLLARLVFPDPPEAIVPRSWRRWPAEAGRHLVLSSGGKDSLLTFGLLRELGREVHPVYINESGRHWYTAINAYRWFDSRFPETARVWTNCDRVFAWMLRQLPFIREDFASVRSDAYPIRLWTVAVFLFAAIPLAKKRGCARIVIGDEYDTTERRTFREIPHYNGLFDQSRYFDGAMSRYYRRKGWRASQFSILRPLSELLIQKLLAQRYPDLQIHQVSCHATHLEGDERVHPCGRCEKCRRVVGMLVATGGDPTQCGYTPEQVEACLTALSTQTLHQEAEGAQHLMWLLSQQGRVGALPSGAARERPEVLKLRFDPERSPIDAIPTDLRKPLFEILLEHADGAVRREGRHWQSWDPLRDPSLLRPFAFESPQAAGTPGAASESAPDARRDYALATMTWPEARARFRETDLAILPVGAIEQHGPHLPLDVDAWDAEYLARRVAEGCSLPRPLVLPLIPYGVSHHHDDFAGTISVSPETLSRLVYEVGMSVARHGITKLVIINGHGGNHPTLQFAAQLISRDAHIFTCVDTGETSDNEIAKLIQASNDAHAGEAETSTTLATRPELVQMDKAKRAVPRFSSRYLDFSSAESVDWYAQTAKISSSGVLGDPTLATREKGEEIWRLMIEHLVAFVERLKGMSLDEIYGRRY